MKRFIIPMLWLCLLIEISSTAYADNGSLGCALNVEQYSLGALPDITDNTEPLKGYSCELIPRYSTFLGNWFPTLPKLSISKSSRAAASKTSSEDFYNAWQAELAIKRLGQSQLVLRGSQKSGEQTLTAQKDISFFPDTATNPQDAVPILDGQKTSLEYSEKTLGLILVMPYREYFPLTEFLIQQVTIQQPVQANLLNLPERSLFNADIKLMELGIRSWSNHDGLNINWELGMARGEVHLKSNMADQINDKTSEIASLRASVEMLYQHKLTRRWFTFASLHGNVRFWQQTEDKNEDYRIAQSSNSEQKIRLGVRFKF